MVRSSSLRYWTTSTAVRPHTMPFSLDGTSYEINLSDENAAALRNELGYHVAAAQKTGGRKVRVAAAQAPPNSPVNSERNRAIRARANDNGYEVSDRGRLSSEVIAAYERAQEQPPAPARERTPHNKLVARQEIKLSLEQRKGIRRRQYAPCSPRQMSVPSTVRVL